MKSITDNFELLEKRARFSRSDLIGAQEILENFSEYKISELDSKVFEALKQVREARTQIEAARQDLMVFERSLKERGIL